MANDQPNSELESLAGELSAIEKRFAAATKEAEKKLLGSQFAQRIEHLADRIKTLTDPPPPSAS